MFLSNRTSNHSCHYDSIVDFIGEIEKELDMDFDWDIDNENLTNEVDSKVKSWKKKHVVGEDEVEWNKKVGRAANKGKTRVQARTKSK